jgi:hypothetical protein
MIYAISYDLKQPGRNYQNLYDTIKSAPGYIWAMDSLWFISTSESVEAWAKRLREKIDQNDHLFVVDISRKPRQGWLPKNVWEWLDKHGG